MLIPPFFPPIFNWRSCFLLNWEKRSSYSLPHFSNLNSITLSVFIPVYFDLPLIRVDKHLCSCLKPLLWTGFFFFSAIKDFCSSDYVFSQLNLYPLIYWTFPDIFQACNNNNNNNKSLKKVPRIPVMAQQKQIWPVSTRMQVWSLASSIGLRIQHCCELWWKLQLQLRSWVAVAVV